MPPVCAREGCEASLAGRSTRAKWCSKRCNDVARGMVRAEPLAGRECAVCGETFAPAMPHSRYCSKECKRRCYVLRPRRPYAQRFTDAQREKSQRRRARKAGVNLDGKVYRTRIAERDGWVCGICAEPVDPSLAYPDPMSASLDHVIPLSRGGSHSPANVRLAHLGCNVRRGAPEIAA